MSTKQSSLLEGTDTDTDEAQTDDQPTCAADGCGQPSRPDKETCSESCAYCLSQGLEVLGTMLDAEGGGAA